MGVKYWDDKTSTAEINSLMGDLNLILFTQNFDIIPETEKETE